MQKMIGVILLTGVIVAGCRPLGTPVVPVPAETGTTTTIPPPARTTTTQRVSEARVEPVAEEPHPVDVDVDLSELDDLLIGLDNTLATLEDAMTEGVEE